MDVSKFKFFLQQHKTKNEFNFISLVGGKYFIPSDHSNEFISLFLAACPHFTNENCTSLVWRPPSGKPMMLCFDFDISLSENIRIENPVFIELAFSVAEIVCEHTKIQTFGVILTRKSGNYQKGENFQTGFHMFCPGILCGKETALRIREDVLPLLDLIRTKFPIVTTAESILDRSVAPMGSNGLILCGDRKRGLRGGPYRVFWRAAFNASDKNWTNPESFLPEDSHTILSETRDFLWGWLWETPDWPNVEDNPSPEPPVEPPAKKQKILSKPSEFNLRLFLDVCAPYIPTHSEWLQIVYFCAGRGLPKEEVCDLCNEFWRPLDSGENARVFDSFEHKSITKGSIIHYLNNHAQKEFDFREIFPRKHFRYYNACFEFSVAKGHVWNLEILKNYCADVFNFSLRESKFIYKTHAMCLDKHQNPYDVVECAVCDRMPFAGNDAMYALVAHTEQEMVFILEKQLPKNVKPGDLKNIALLALKSSLPSKSYRDRMKMLREGLDFKPKRMLLGKIFEKQMRCGYIPRYHHMTFRPFLFEDNTPPNVYNTFSGFPLVTYRPTEHVDWKKTRIFDWLYDCFAHRDDHRMEKLLNLLAWFIQNPEKRSERLWVIMSKEQGTGKTSLYYFLTGLFGSEMGMFFHNLDEFLGPFNASMMNKKILWVDDIGDSTPRQAKALHSMVTAKQMLYNQKNEKAFTLDTSAEMFVTSNSTTPIFVTAQDRRCAYLHVSDLHIQDRVFFAKVYSEFGNSNVMHAWFYMLARRDIENWEPVPANDLDSITRLNQKVACMGAPASFVCNFYGDEGWISRFSSGWDYEIRVVGARFQRPKGTVRIRVLATRFYSDFKAWNTVSGTKTKIKETTFWSTAERIGIVPKRKQRWKEGKYRTLVILFYTDIRKAMAKLVEGFELPPWPTEDPDLRQQMVAELEGGAMPFEVSPK